MIYEIKFLSLNTERYKYPKKNSDIYSTLLTKWKALINGVTVFVNRTADIKETRPISKYKTIDLTILFLNNFLISSSKRGKNNIAEIAIKKSSSLMETYVPGTFINGNLGYKGIAITRIVIKYL